MYSLTDFQKKFIYSIISRSRKFVGHCIKDIVKTYDLDVNIDSKNYAAEVIFKVLGISGGGHFFDTDEKSSVYVKTVRCNPNLKYIETMSLRGFDYMKIIKEKWANSKLKQDISNILMIVLELPVEKVHQEEARFVTTIFHRPNPIDEEIIKNDWKEIVSMMEDEKADEINANYGRIVQVRPKAANKDDKILAPGNKMVVRSAFFIRNFYIQNILENYKLGIIKNYLV